MAYTPSLADISNTAAGSYKPSVADIEELSSSANSQPALADKYPGIKAFVNVLPGGPIASMATNQFLKHTSPNSTIGRLGRDVIGGDINVLGANLNLPHQINPSIPEVVGNDVAQQLGVQNPGVLDKGIQGAGTVIGNVAGFMGGGVGLDALRGAAEGLPIAGKVSQFLGGKVGGTAMKAIGGAANRAIGSAGYGALTNPNDRSTGALEGAGASLAFDAIPAGLGLIGRATQALKPTQYAQQIVTNLGAGKSLENNAKSLAQDIENTYKQKSDANGLLYSDIFNNIGNSRLYNGLENSAYQNIDKKLLNHYDYDLNDLHDQFTANPTFQNAHLLQSQLGSSIRQLSKNPAPDVATNSTIQAYQRSRNALKSDMDGFLTSTDPSLNLADKYKKATDDFVQNVAPYRENSQLLKIATGDITNPKNIANIFKNPEPEIQTVLSHLPEGTQNKILYSELGKPQNAKPERLVKAVEGLDQKGLGSYVTPELMTAMDTLSRRVSNRDFAQRGAGFLAGGVLGHGAGAELAGAGIGALVSPPIIKGMHALVPQSVRNAISAAAKTTYPLTAKAAIATSLNGNN